MLRPSSVFIHPKAHVDDDVKIGGGSKIWQFASVIRRAEVGCDVSVGSCAIVDGAIVGDRSTIGHGAQVHPGTLIGADVFVGPGVVFCNDMWPAVSKDGFDDQAIGHRHTVIVEAFASIGANAVILPGIRIGAGAVVAAGAVVDENVPAGVVVRRNAYTSPTVPENWRNLRMRWAD